MKRAQAILMVAARAAEAAGAWRRPVGVRLLRNEHSSEAPLTQAALAKPASPRRKSKKAEAQDPSAGGPPYPGATKLPPGLTQTPRKRAAGGQPMPELQPPPRSSDVSGGSGAITAAYVADEMDDWMGVDPQLRRHHFVVRTDDATTGNAGEQRLHDTGGLSGSSAMGGGDVGDLWLQYFVQAHASGANSEAAQHGSVSSRSGPSVGTNTNLAASQRRRASAVGSRAIGAAPQPMTIEERDRHLASGGGVGGEAADSDEASNEAGGYEDDSDDLAVSPTLWSQGSFDAVAGRFRQARTPQAAATGMGTETAESGQTRTRDTSDLWTGSGSSSGVVGRAIGPQAATDAALHDTDVVDHFGNPMHGSGP